LKTLLTTSAFRAPIVLLAALAWLAVSNHCTLAAVEGPARMAAMQSCHDTGASHSPAKHQNENGVECCKVLRATLSTVAKTLAPSDISILANQPCFSGFILLPEQLRPIRPLELDTGPPFATSFTESVLQRSILAHAPPSLA
jgi:hypothetical protein